MKRSFYSFLASRFFDKIEPMTKFTKKESAIFQFGFLLGLGAATICFAVYIFSSS